MKENYTKRRNKLFHSLKNNSICVLHSGYEKHKSADSIYPFVVNNNFFYFTGIDQADVTLIIGNFNNQISEYLFLDAVDELMSKWVGKTLTKQEASDISGIPLSNIMDNNAFENTISMRFLQISRYYSNKAEIVYLDLEKPNMKHYNSFGYQYARYLQKNYPGVTIYNIYDNIIENRMVKDEHEIATITESVMTTKAAIENVMKNSKNLTNESMAMAYYDFINKASGKKESFEAIIASGKNAAILHYVDNNAIIASDSLLLMDVGCYTKHYASDLTRTFPVSGRFSERQKAIYQVVLDCNKACIKYAKDGVSWLDLNNYAKEILANGCIKLGLIKEAQELSKYYFHSIGHSLGLDVHDPSIYNLGLKENMVITIEPGLYIEEENIGIRIEDNIVITKGEAIVLSKDLVKEINDIENFLK